MKASTALFELVSSLEPQEIEAVRQAARLHVKGGENIYLQVFEKVLSQSEYDEQAIISLLGYNEDLNKFAFFKNYLYNYVLKILEQRHDCLKKKVRNSISKIDLLIGRNLYQLAEEEIIKAESICRDYQLIHLWICLLEYKLLILEEKERSGNDIRNELAQLRQEATRLMKARRSLVVYKKLFCLVRKRHHHSTFLQELEQHCEFSDVMKSELMESDSSLNFFHRNYFLFAKGIYYYATRDYAKAAIIVNEMLRIWEDNRKMNRVFFGAFYNTYYNKALNELKREEYAEALKTCLLLMRELNALHKGNTFDRYMLYNLMMSVYNSCGYFDKALETALHYSSARSHLNRKTHHAQSEQLYHFNCAIASFGTGNYKQANKELNLIINDDIEYADNVTCLAHFLSLLVHFELGNMDLLSYRIKSVQRYLTRKNCLMRSEQVVLDFFRQYTRHLNQTDARQMFGELLKKVNENIAANPVEKNLLGMFDLQSWIASKAEGITFMEMARRKKNFALS